MKRHYYLTVSSAQALVAALCSMQFIHRLLVMVYECPQLGNTKPFLWLRIFYVSSSMHRWLSSAGSDPSRSLQTLEKS